MIFLFDGQGAFTPGFGREWVAHSAFRDTFERLSPVLGWDLAEAAWGKEAFRTARQNGKLQGTLFALDLALAHLLSAKTSAPGLVAGHSLGELAALVFSGAVSEVDGASLVGLRGSLMEAAGKEVEQDMLAVLTRDHALVESYLEANEVFVSNRNADDQLVVAGTLPALRLLARRLTSEHRIVSRFLGTGVACHTPLLHKADGRMRAAIARLPIRRPRVPFFCVGANRALEAPETIRSFLSEQMLAPVEWARAMRTFQGLGYRRGVEVGPSKILKGLALRSSPDLSIQTFTEVMKNGLARD